MSVTQAGAIVSLSDFKERLRIDSPDDDAELTRLILDASSWMEQTLNRVVVERESIIEFHDPMPNRRTIILNCKSITPTTSVDLRLDTLRVFGVDTQLIENTDFTIDEDVGIIELEGSTFNFSRSSLRKTIKVTYSAGYVSGEIPLALRQATIHLAGFWYQRFNDQTALFVGSKSVPGGGNVTVLDGIPKGIWDVIKPFMTPAVG